MLIYEKRVGQETKLYGSVSNIPTADDKEIVLRDDTGAELEIVPGDSYVDNGHGGIVRRSDNKTVNVDIVAPDDSEINAIPGDWDPETRVLTSIEVTTEPTKKNYVVGDAFDTTGMVVTAIYSNGTEEVVTEYTVAPANGYEFVADDISDAKSVTVTYSEKTDSFNIVVTAE